MWERPRALRLLQAVTGARVQFQAIELLQLPDLVKGCLTKRGLAVERMQDDPLQQIPQGQVVVLAKGFKNLEQALFNSNSGLHPLDQEALRPISWYQCTMVRQLADKFHGRETTPAITQ